MQSLDEKLFEFLKSENLLNIDFYSDSEKIVFHDTKINKKFLLVNNSFQKFFSQSLEEYGRKIDRHNTLKDYILEYSRLCGFIDGNDKLKMYKNMGFFKNSYAEFVIIQRDYQIDIGNLGEFFIGKQKIEISNASSMFKVIFKYLEENNDFRWNNVKTIKLSNIGEENVNDYLQEVLFLLEYYNPWVFQLGHISSFEYMYDKSLIKKFKSKVIEHSKYTEPIYFFNEAIKRYYSNPEDETVFLYFYKVIEHFFFINRKAEIIKIINENISDMDKLLKGMNDIYKTEERRCLTYVLRNELVETNINKILLKAKKNKLILKKNSEALAKGIYDYRNSIVHGKGDSNLKLRIPWTLDEDIILVLWNQIIKELAIVCISVFCYDNVLLTS